MLINLFHPPAVLISQIHVSYNLKQAWLIQKGWTKDKGDGEDWGREKGSFTCAELLLNIGRNRCLQYWWNRSVPINNGMVNPDATDERLSPNTPSAISWENINENTVVLWAIGQNCPPLSYFVMYTLIIWTEKLCLVEGFCAG